MRAFFFKCGNETLEIIWGWWHMLPGGRRRKSVKGSRSLSVPEPVSSQLGLYETLSLKQNLWSQTDGSAIKITYCSYEGPDFGSQPPHGGSQPPVTPVPGGSSTFGLYGCLHEHITHTRCIKIHLKKHFMHFFKTLYSHH